MLIIKKYPSGTYYVLVRGHALVVKDEEDVERFTSFIATFRKVEPNRPLVVLLEDIDSIASENRYQTARLLNILDGVKQIIQHGQF